jgi:hypothetical protein
VYEPHESKRSSESGDRHRSEQLCQTFEASKANLHVCSFTLLMAEVRKHFN